jgi:site-specific DNA-methyltransferase (adenine-specific)
MSIQLLQGDCLEVMKTLPDKSIDLFLCDLPYGCLTTQTGEPKGFIRPSQEGTNLVGKLKHIGTCAWDIKLDLVAFWEQVERLMKDEHTPIIHFCNVKFGYELIKSKEKWFRYDLVWNKLRGVSFLLANKMPMSAHEHIYIFAKKGATYYRKDYTGDFPPSLVSKKHLERNTIHAGVMPKVLSDNTGRRCVTTVLEYSNLTNTRKGGHHPTQKPADLYAWLVERYSKEGDMVLDPTAGSFTSVFTAQKLGRNAIGIEKNEAFYATAKASCPSSP